MSQAFFECFGVSCQHVCVTISRNLGIISHCIKYLVIVEKNTQLVNHNSHPTIGYMYIVSSMLNSMVVLVLGLNIGFRFNMCICRSKNTFYTHHILVIY